MSAISQVYQNPLISDLLSYRIKINRDKIELQNPLESLISLFLDRRISSTFSMRRLGQKNEKQQQQQLPLSLHDSPCFTFSYSNQQNETLSTLNATHWKQFKQTYDSRPDTYKTSSQ